MKTNTNIRIKQYAFMLFVLVFSACGAGDDYNHPHKTTYTGKFLDSAVEGLSYHTGSISGVTDNEGTFEYHENEIIQFSVGNITIGETAAKPVITPMDLCPGITDIAAPCITNLCRFLQTLDDDGNPDNGILVSTDNLIHHEIELNFYQSISNFNFFVQNQFGLTLKPEKDAQVHLMHTLYGELQSIKITPEEPSTPQGIPIQLKALGEFSETPEIIDITNLVNWSSINSNIATFSSQQMGMINSYEKNIVRIFAKLGDIDKDVILEISEPIVTKLEIIPQDPVLHPYNTQQFSVLATRSDGTANYITDETIKWSSRNQNIAIVETHGTAHSLTPGTTQIITEYEGVYASVDIFVNNGSLTEIQIYPDSNNTSIAKGFDRQLYAIGVYSDNTHQDITEQVTWESDYNSIAKVSNSQGSKGLINAISKGETSIRAIHNDIHAVIDLTVSDAELLRIEISPKNTTIPLIFKDQQFKAEACFTDDTREDVTLMADWISMNPDIAQFKDDINFKGLLTANSPGTATIQATYESQTGQTFLNVSNASIESILIKPQNASVSLGETCQFLAEGLFSDDSRFDITKKANWSVSEKTVARVNNNSHYKGLVITESTGKTDVLAVFQQVSNFATLTVKSPTLISIQISPTHVVLGIDETKQLLATGYYTDNAITDITSIVNWTSSDPGIVTVTNGKIKGIAYGEADITAELNGKLQFTDINVRENK